MESNTIRQKIAELEIKRYGIGRIIDDRGLHNIPIRPYVNDYEAITAEINKLLEGVTDAEKLEEMK